MKGLTQLYSTSLICHVRRSSALIEIMLEDHHA